MFLDEVARVTFSSLELLLPGEDGEGWQIEDFNVQSNL